MSALGEGEDYYLEDGRMVFTAAYHLKRGSCCGNRCRHCPYAHEAARALSPPPGSRPAASRTTP